MIRSQISDFVRSMKQRYPIGCRIECDSCAYPWNPIKKGERGTVILVDSIGTVHVEWDNGRSLGLIYSEDKFHIVEGEENNEDRVREDKEQI